MMDHDVVVSNYTAERYLLGELTETEREAYEEHYFDCAECAEEIQCGAEFVQMVREVGNEEPRNDQPVRGPAAIWRSGWFRPMAAAACGLLALGLSVNVYQTFRTQSAHFKAAPLTVALTESRSPAEEGPVVPANQEVRLKFPISPGGYKAYHLMVVGHYDGAAITGMITAEAISLPAELQLAEHQLKPGKYSVIVNGIKEDSTIDKEKVYAQFPFSVVEKTEPKN
jgi:anti-sigma factor RsiW